MSQQVKNAKVKKAQLVLRKGCLVCELKLKVGGDSGGAGGVFQNYGDRVLANRSGGHKRASEKLYELLQFFSVEKLRDIEGSPVRVVYESGSSKIDHLKSFMEEDSFYWDFEKGESYGN
jgi:hypothetical protein